MLRFFALLFLFTTTAQAAPRNIDADGYRTIDHLFTGTFPRATATLVCGPTSSVDGEIALFSGTTGYTIKRATGSGYVNVTSGVYATKTNTQVTADLNQFTSSLQGLVPGSGGGTTNFLRADGTWAAPSGGSSSLRVFNVAFGGTTENTNSCTSSPCTIYRQLDSSGNTNTVSSVVRDGTGDYHLVITGGRCTTVPVCSYTAFHDTNFAVGSSTNNNSTTLVQVRVKAADNTANDGELMVVCTCTP